MVIAYHLIFGAYGFWLPNDPRGSWSDYVGSLDLLRFGPATKTSETRSVAGRKHDVALRLAAKQALKYPPVLFNDTQIQSIGDGFHAYVKKSALVLRACAIMPDHVHLVFDRFRIDAEQVAIQLKASAMRQLLADGRHPFQHIKLANGRPPKCWARGEWFPFLETEDDVRRAITYVEANPEKEGKPRQTWEFVTPLAP